MSLADHIRYLELRLAGFVPESIHRHQIDAYKAAIEAARGATSDGAFPEATGDLIELTRSEWLDRYDAVAELCESLGNPIGAEIARSNADAARGATDHQALVTAIVAAKLTARTGARVHVSTLVGALIEHRLDPTDERRDDLESVWRECAVDPSFGLDKAPYRRQLPFADAGVEQLGEWIRSLDLKSPETGEMPEPAPPVIEIPTPGSSTPPAEVVAAGYRAAAAAVGDSPHLAPLKKTYARIDELAATAANGIALLAAMADEDLFVRLARAPLVAAAREARSELDDATPIAAHHDRLIADLEAARSVAEIELVQLAADECLSIEWAWAQLLFSVALRPSVAALAHGVEGSETSRRRALESERIALALLGAGTASLLATQPIWRAFERELFDRGQDISPVRDDGGDPQARRGELQLQAAGRARAVAINWAIGEADPRDPDALDRLLGQRRFESAEDMRDHIVAEIDRLGTPEGGEPWPLLLHGEAVRLDDLDDALASPPRPELPL